MRLKKYGPKSEKLSEEQFELLELEPGVHAQEVEKEPRRSLPGEEDSKSASMPGATPCPRICRGARKSSPWKARRGSACAAERSAACIGYEEKEVLDMEPARYFVRVIKREKLACRKCPEGGVVTAAAGGPKIVEKGKLSDAVVVDVLIKKYLSHLPLYRQAGRFAERLRDRTLPQHAQRGRDGGGRAAASRWRRS